MKKIITLLFCISIFSPSLLNSQSLYKADFLKVNKYDSTHQIIFDAAELLFSKIESGRFDSSMLVKKNVALTHSVFSSLRNATASKARENKNFFKKQIVNYYPLTSNDYWLTVAYMGLDSSDVPILRYVIDMIAKVEGKQVSFTIPLDYYTKGWHRAQIGTVRYIYRDTFNFERAEKFNSKNKDIAHKFNLEPETLDFYMCENYAELNRFLGITYDFDAFNQYDDGYGVDANTIFSIQLNEDFSHDIFHFYSGKVNKIINRNWIAEEGIAYSWGNAYYADRNGEMIEQGAIADALKKYLAIHPNTSLLKLFDERPMLFPELSTHIKVQSFLSSLICDEIERQHGMNGIQQIINAGRKPSRSERFLSITDKLIGINRTNFDERVADLLRKY